VCRYYIKHEAQTEPLLPDSMLDDIIRESQLHFLQLNCVEVATQLTLHDLQCFRDIEQSEYIIDLFKLHTDNNKRCQTTHLDAFTEASLYTFCHFKLVIGKVKTFMFGIVEDTNKRVRPCRWWMDGIVSWCKTELQELISLVQDRRRCQLITSQAVYTSGRWFHGYERKKKEQNVRDL